MITKFVRGVDILKLTKYDVMSLLNIVRINMFM